MIQFHYFTRLDKRVAENRNFGWAIEQKSLYLRGTGAVRRTTDREERLLGVNGLRDRFPTSR